MAENLFSNLTTVGDVVIVQRWAAVSKEITEWNLINQLEGLHSVFGQYLL